MLTNEILEEIDQYEIFLKDASVQLFPATVEIGCRDWTDDRRHTECRITLRWTGGEIEGMGGHFFESFKRVGEQLELQDIYPMCYGASHKIVITGMAADMGLGMKVYKAELGSFPRLYDLVHIFASGVDVDPVPVQVQEEFQREWAKSIRRK